MSLSVLTEAEEKKKSKLSLDESKEAVPRVVSRASLKKGRPKKKGTWVCNEGPL